MMVTNVYFWWDFKHEFFCVALMKNWQIILNFQKNQI